ncbi:MerR family transcriptional regulator [Kordiimonas sp. SCSIO 12603]|uniref:MerR family transcriptional regulator n=1 Tax=Kordiimonas sp. SCSIO 12603 TaxID=2829596 RepID=UPI0021030B71|nr:MerR family transcriptional regulator [Kordiimonas sp. SCSIO 12603]UTW59476.1 MerR family transcriptional regulator [Kordiimonas sp. SCSIO 12603]
MTTAIRIGEVADRVGLPQKTIRYYEDIGLVTPLRSDNGFRYFREKDIQTLMLIKSARDFGFSIAQCKDLLGMLDGAERSNVLFKEFTIAHLKQLEDKIRRLTTAYERLHEVANSCSDDEETPCTILELMVKVPTEGNLNNIQSVNDLNLI